ncbi:MAG: transcription elongation factor GreA [bacterium]|nr:transcription elongation factor GreA [bacterium]
MAYITKQGLEKLKQELEELKTTKRRELAERLRKAIAMGDLSENFDYKDAKEQQEFLERRIAELSREVSESQVVEKAGAGSGVRVGSGVTVESEGIKMTFAIVGAAEADSLHGKLSVYSPMGKALVGRKEGDAVEVDTPGGKTSYRILEVK